MYDLDKKFADINSAIVKLQGSVNLLAADLRNLSLSSAAGLAETSLNIAKLAEQVQVLTTLVTPIPVDPQIQWRADHEAGDLSEWDNGGVSGSAESVAVLASSVGITAKSGNWMMRQSVTGPSGGTRMAKFAVIDQLVKAGTPFWISWWDYFPMPIKFAPSDMFMIWQIASYDENGVPNPIWGLYIDGALGSLSLGWSPAGNAPAEGPHTGESGTRGYSNPIPVPVGRWAFFEIYVKAAADYTGELKLWLDRQQLFDLTQIKTRFPDSTKGGYMYCTHNAYGANLTPTPAVHYVDDVTISLGRMP